MKQLSRKELKKFFKTQLKRKQEIVLVLENIQYDRNVAAIFRTADAAGVSKIYLTGITNTPNKWIESLKRVSREKEITVTWQYEKNSYWVLQNLAKERFVRIAVELTNSAMPLDQLKRLTDANERICLVFGSEMHGIKKDTLNNCDDSVFIPMYGKGASLNVAASAAIVLYSI